MRYKSLSEAQFLDCEDFAGCWRSATDLPDNIRKIMLGPFDDKLRSDDDYYTPLDKGREWLFELTCRHQPRTGALLMQAKDMFLRARNINYDTDIMLDFGLEVLGKVVLVNRNYAGLTPSDPDYEINFEQKNEVLGRSSGPDGIHRHLSLPLPIREAYYTRFNGLAIPDDPIIETLLDSFLLIGDCFAWQTWDDYLDEFKGCKKKYLPWLDDRIPGVRPQCKDDSYTNFMMFLDTRPTLCGREGDVFFVKNHIQDGVIYHVRDVDVENMRILSQPAEAIDRYCEHVLLEKEGCFDFLPYTSAM